MSRGLGDVYKRQRKYKLENKLALQRELGLEEDGSKFVIGLISRLTNQKGLDLVNAIMGQVLDGNTQVVVLGTGDWNYEEAFRHAAAQYPGRFAAHMMYSASLSTAIYGGAAMSEQLRRLAKGVDIVVGTPGRVLDHIRRGTLKLENVRYLVLDEADEMLNMGFVEDVEEIMGHTGEDRRVLLFSATMPERIIRLSEAYMRNTEVLRVESQHLTADLTNQIYFEVREGDKFDALTRIIDVEPEFYGIVFSRTRTGADDIVAKLLERGYAAEVLHGDISQAQREKILGKFKKKQVNILVATDCLLYTSPSPRDTR